MPGNLRSKNLKGHRNAIFGTVKNYNNSSNNSNRNNNKSTGTRKNNKPASYFSKFTLRGKNNYGSKTGLTWNGPAETRLKGMREKYTNIDPAVKKELFKMQQDVLESLRYGIARRILLLGEKAIIGGSGLIFPLLLFITVPFALESTKYSMNKKVDWNAVKQQTLDLFEKLLDGVNKMTKEQQHTVIEAIKEDHQKQVELLRKGVNTKHASKNSERWSKLPALKKDPMLIGSLLSILTS